MTTYALVHGSSSAGFYWDRVNSALEAAGHTVVAPDLPTSDDTANFSDYADAVDQVLRAVGPVVGSDLIVVGHSMGGFTAPVVASRHPGARLVLIAPMIPLPGETPSQYFRAVHLDDAQKRAASTGGYDPDFDVVGTLLHDVPSEVVEELLARGEPRQAETIFAEQFPLQTWPDASTRVIACTEDRMFPLPLIEQVARERLDIRAEHLVSGHLPGFGHPEELAELLLRDAGSR